MKKGQVVGEFVYDIVLIIIAVMIGLSVWQVFLNVSNENTFLGGTLALRTGLTFDSLAQGPGVGYLQIPVVEGHNFTVKLENNRVLVQEEKNSLVAHKQLLLGQVSDKEIETKDSYYITKTDEVILDTVPVGTVYHHDCGQDEIKEISFVGLGESESNKALADLFIARFSQVPGDVQARSYVGSNDDVLFVLNRQDIAAGYAYVKGVRVCDMLNVVQHSGMYVIEGEYIFPELSVYKSHDRLVYLVIPNAIDQVDLVKKMVEVLSNG